MSENEHEIPQFIVDIRTISQSLGDFEPQASRDRLRNRWTATFTEVSLHPR